LSSREEIQLNQLPQYQLLQDVSLQILQVCCTGVLPSQQPLAINKLQSMARWLDPTGGVFSRDSSVEQGACNVPQAYLLTIGGGGTAEQQQ